MTTRSSLAVLACAVALLGPFAPTHAADSKTFPATSCQPRIPNTAANEIRLLGNGIANYGDADRQVVCPFMKDMASDWTEGNNSVEFYFKTGSVPGRVACTAYISGPVFGAEAYGTVTDSPTVLPANTRGDGEMALVDVPDDLGIAPASMICTISPKTIFGGFYFNEEEATDGDI